MSIAALAKFLGFSSKPNSGAFALANGSVRFLFLLSFADVPNFEACDMRYASFQ